VRSMNMLELEESLARELNPRERRRLYVYGMLPVDAIDEKFSPTLLAAADGGFANLKLLYRYGCDLDQMNVGIGGHTNEVVPERSKPTSFFQLRGC